MPRKRLTEEGVNKLSFERAQKDAEKEWRERPAKRLASWRKKNPEATQAEIAAKEKELKTKPRPKLMQIDYFDAGMPGLVLRVNYGGAKVWRALYYRKKLGSDGKKLMAPTTHKLGAYPVFKLKEARDKARQFLADPQKGLAQAASETFKEVSDTFIKRYVDVALEMQDSKEKLPLRSKENIERILNNYIHPEWQHRNFRELKRSDVTELLEKIEDEHGARQADIALAIIRKMMNWWAGRTDDYVSPIVKGMKRYNAKARKRTRILGCKWLPDEKKYDDTELIVFWNGCSETDIFGALLKVLLLTAQRRGKVAKMKWADIRNGVWTIPSEPGEKANAKSLYLPTPVLEILRTIPKIEGNPYVFSGSAQGQRRRKGKDGKVENAPSTPPSFNSFSQRKAELDEKLKEEIPDMARWTIHDLRRTAKSLMARAGVRPDISERVLGHAIAGVEGVYDQHDYSAEKADALNRLAALIETIRNPPEGNVVPLAAAVSKRRKPKAKARATA